MTEVKSRYFAMDEDARETLKKRARLRYMREPERHRLKRYLHCLNAGKVQCPKQSTLMRHGIEPLGDGSFGVSVNSWEEKT